MAESWRGAPDPRCPLASEHVYQQDPCEGCGWDGYNRQSPSGPKDMSRLTGPERIREVIARDGGAYAPTRPVVICDRRPTPTPEETR